jgi:Ca2+-binding EF-hand superfamily protein
MKRNLMTTAFVALLAAPFVANAADMGRLGDNLVKYDANKDGMITREEVRVGRKTQFDQLDRNHDGAITDADVPRMAKRAKGAQFQILMQSFDTNGDKRINRDEFVNGPMPGFDQADTDKNGVVDGAELKAFRSSH